MIILTVSLGSCVSLGSYREIRGWQAHLTELRFASLARDHLQTLNSGLTDTIDVLRSIRAYFESLSRPVTREEFQAFSHSFRDRAVGLRDTGWAPRVTASGRDAFEQAIRESGWPDFQIVEFGADHKMIRAKERPEYFPIIYSDPGPINRPVMGFDFGSEPVRKATIVHAIAADAPEVTQPLKLINETRPVGGMMGFIPVTRPEPPDGADHPHQVIGIVGVVFETAPMIENILATKLRLGDLDMYVFDPGGSAGNRLIYWHSSSGKPAPGEAELLVAPHWQGALRLADQQLSVIFSPSAGFGADDADWGAVAVLTGGLAMTGSVAGYLWFTVRRTRKLERLTTSLRETTDELRRNGAKLDYIARHDALTGLPNRTMFREKVNACLRHAHHGQALAVLYLDLDRFKAVNDTLGHPAGDQLLCQVAGRLRESVRDSDTITRLGGDEFAIAQSGASQPQAAESLSRRVIEALGAPYNINGHLVAVGVSIGVTLTHPGDHDADQLLRRADMGLYAAKRDGRGTWRFFEPAMDYEAQARLGLEMDLRHALEHDEFDLYYQPQVNIADGTVLGFEALLRWHHPVRGLVLPGDFIRCAEETGLILPIGEWVLNKALRDAADWPEGLSVAVNLSPYQLVREDLADIVQTALGRSGQIGARLELEVTERALIQHLATGQATLNLLHMLGVRITMDDFGTGYASLSHLRSFPFDRIKIDQSFVSVMTESDGGAAIVRAILQVAASLDIAILAEGVETQDQIDLLAAMGCREAQGFLFSPARPAGDVPQLLAGRIYSRANSLHAGQTGHGVVGD